MVGDCRFIDEGRNKNQFQKIGNKLGGMEMAEGDNYGLLVLCAFIHADIACTYTSDSCTKRIPGGLRILITGSFSERREGSDPTHGVKEFTYIHMIDWSTWQPDGLLQVHL